MTSARATSELVMEIVPALTRLMRTKFREKRVGELSMAGFRTLAFIDMNEGASLSEVASQIGLELPSMSKLIDKLVLRELITREMHSGDRRRICLALTSHGKRELDEAHQHAQAYFSEKFSKLSEAERAHIAEAMQSIRILFDLNSAKSARKISAQPR